MNVINTPCFLVLFVLFITTIGYGQNFTDEQLNHILQTGSESEIVQLNTKLVMNNNFYHASLTADKLLSFDKESSNYNYRKGYAILKSSEDYKNAHEFLEVAATKINKNFDMMSAKENKAPIDALFYLARSYHLMERLDEAIDFYQQFSALIQKKSPLFDEANVLIQQCIVAKGLIVNPIDYEVINLGTVINSSNPEYSPVISLDGKTLYFTSRRLHPDSLNINIKEPGTNLYLEDVYVSNKNKAGKWNKPEILDFCKPEYNEATIALSTDGQKLYVYMDETGNGDIYYSNVESEEFHNLKYLKDKGVNTDAWETHFTVSPDGKRKFFVSDRKGGYGGRDIYMTEQNEKGAWSEPKNLGPKINTPYDEDAPFIAIDNKTMYFANNGPKSMGGFDIFKTTIDKNGDWSEPENLGYPLNSTNDDIYYTTTIDGLTGYLTSFRSGGFGMNDIYEVKNKHLGINYISILFGEIETSNKTSIPDDLFFNIKCLDCVEPYAQTFSPNSKGNFFVTLPSCQEYELIYYHGSDKNEILKETIKTECTESYQEIFRYLVLDVPSMEFISEKELLASYSPLSMKHFFGYNNNVLDTEKGALKVFLDSLSNQIQQGRTSIEIEINASSSTVPTKTFRSNNELSEKRALEIKQLLLNYYSQREMVDSVKITINKTIVAGPEYTGDYEGISKYAPYQYVELKVNGINSLTNDSELISSSDDFTLVKKENARNAKNQQVDIVSNKALKSDGYKYHVIVGVFRKRQFAEGMVKNSISKGFDAKIIGKRNDLDVVSVGSANTIKEANDILRQAREEVIQSAWILNIKK